MFWRKSREIQGLQRLVRERTAERDAVREDHKAAAAECRYLARQLERSEGERASLCRQLQRARTETAPIDQTGA
ncbi:hypothetical protein ACFV1H_17955 [Streptomyces virginiae]|uniref:hypothetical protein n=1 Tax=Streptomyces virginiae TaxID=1961 RepID=UPI0036BAF0F6